MYSAMALAFTKLPVNIISAFFLLACGWSTELYPADFPRLSLFGMSFPFLLLLNLIFVAFWLVFSIRRVWIPIVGLLISWPYIHDYCPVNWCSDVPEGAIKVMTDAFLNGEVDEIYLSCNSFKNTMVQTPLVGKLLPLEPNKENESSKRHWDYLYEPEPESILKVVLDRYVMQMVYQAVLENLASEQAARMVAMKAATDNAEALVSDLQLEYNKARQAGITMELNDIVSGASAV